MTEVCGHPFSCFVCLFVFFYCSFCLFSEECFKAAWKPARPRLGSTGTMKSVLDTTNVLEKLLQQQSMSHIRVKCSGVHVFLTI